MSRHHSTTGLLAGLALLVSIPAHAADHDDTQTLPSIAVTNSAERQKVLDELRSMPGATGVRFGDDYRERTVIGLGDVLGNMAGVYAQRPSGQEASKISIRGSGIAAANIRGIRLLRDGLPLARLDDLNEGIYADVMTAERIEVYRGASSLQYGAATLGGAINLVSPTAYTSPGAALRLEAGSDGFRRAQLKGGKVFDGGLDAYASVTHYESDGFRQNSAERSSRLYANIGYAFSATSRGRFHLTEERYTGEMPGTLTLAQIHDNPELAAPANLAANARIQTSPRWHLAYRHEWDLEGADKLSVGVFHTGTKFDSPTALVRALYDAVDYGVSLRHEMHGSLAGRDNRFVWGAGYSRGKGDNRLLFGLPFVPDGTVNDRRSNAELYAENTWQATERLALVAGLQGTQARRETVNVTPPFVFEYPNGSDSRTYSSLNPKIGAIWDVGHRIQWYVNLSRVHEAPPSVSFRTSVPPPAAGARTLDMQRATTAEIGARGGDAALSWNAALYRSRLHDELLAMPNMLMPTQPISVNAASPTEHTGFELELQGRQGLSALDGSLEWNLAYTWNRFRFDGDARYGNNRLPGIPDHVLQAGFTYRHASGFYIGPSVALGSHWYADQANTLRAPGYGVVNLGAGYVARSGYRVFIDARNLADKHYAATADYVADARLQPAGVFRPGQTRALFAGIEVFW